MRFFSVESNHFLLPLFVAIVVSVLLVANWDGGKARYVGNANMLVQLKELDARLDRDVLRVTSFLLVQYDPLVKTSTRLRELSQKIKDPQGGFYGSLSPDVDAAVDAYWQAVEEKLELLERIKSQAAVVRNGIHYLPVVVKDLKTRNGAIYDRVMELLNSLYLYNLFASDVRLGQIEQQMDELILLHDLPEAQALLLDNILFHMRANVRGLALLGQLKARFLEISTLQRFEELHGIHEKHREMDSKLTRKVSLGLSILTLLLLLGLWLVFRKFEAARQSAEQARDRLHDAVESLSEGFALFDANARLVLHNRTFLQFYPWLKDRLSEGALLSVIRRENRSHIQLTSLDGTAAADEKEASYIERLNDGRWHLASNSRTKEGGRVFVSTDITASKQAEVEVRKLSRALEQSPASVVITDIDGTIEYVNPKFEQISGFSAKEAIGENPRIMKSGDKSPEEYKEMWDTITAGKEWRGNFHNKRKDGSIYWEAASISPIRNDEGEITHFIAVKEDITARKRAEDQLRMNATVFETTTEGIMVTDADNRVITVNPAFSRITGYEADEIIGRNPNILSSGRHDSDFYHNLWDQVAQFGHWSGEIWNRRKDGSVYPEWLSIVAIVDEQNYVSEYVAVFSDITQRKQDEEQIRYQANYDALTNLPNRSLLQDRLTQAIASAIREEWRLALLFVDLDQFKVVNDTFGHVVGDELLQQVAERLKECVRGADTVARFGGDEFVILLQDVMKADDAAAVANKVIETLSRSFSLSDRDIFIGASIGITLFPDDADNSDTLFQNADMAMYRAKETGRNRYQFFTSSMQQHVRMRQDMEHDLRQALDRGEFELHYQPVVEAATGVPVSVEALLRWRHPQQGLISPDVFIPLAEDTGMIDPIGKWVLHTACAQATAWRKDGVPPLGMAVNISSRQLELGLSDKDLESVLNDTGFPGELLTLEITESLLMEDTEEAIAWLRDFKPLGVAVSIDDFGTGYSSLSYLKRFPVDVIKIDRSFVRGLPDDKDDASLVWAIVAMAKSLGLTLVAEGVEGSEQVNFLNQADCDFLQGFHFAKPMPADEFVRWMEKNGHLQSIDSG